MVRINYHTISDLHRREFAVELAMVLGLLVVAQIYANLTNVLIGPLHDVAQPLLGNQGAYTVAPLVPALGGLTVLVVAYAWVRGVDIPLSVPERDDLGPVALTVVGPVTLASSFSVVVAVQTGVTVDAMRESVAAWGLPYLFTGWWLLRTVAFLPVMSLLYQGLVQGTFRRVVDEELAVALTTLTGTFLLADVAGSFGAFPPLWFRIDTVGALGVLLFCSTLGFAVFASEYTDDRRLRALAVIPMLVVVTVATAGIVASVGSFTGALFGAAQVTVLALAACAYERSDSLLVPMAAYGSFVVTNAVASSVFLDATVAM